MKNPNCDGSGPCNQTLRTVRVLPTGDGNAILCMSLAEVNTPKIEPARYGVLIVVAWQNELPVMMMLSARHTEREQAKLIATREAHTPNRWYGFRQILFLHEDGTMELWDHQLREGWHRE